MNAFLLTSTILAISPADFGPPQVLTSFGLIEGIREDSTTESFLGIPYALPPTGPRRFLRPKPWEGPLTATGEPFQATKPGNMCTQRSHVVVGEAEGTEDCLYLNIHRPLHVHTIRTSLVSENSDTSTNSGPTAAADDAPNNSRGLPVLVYLFGGAFISGDSHWGTSFFRDAVSVYHGDNLVEEHPVIFVTGNYRVGLFGFLATAAQAEENGGVTGNLGLMDQREKLRWVKANIAAFGGDPDRIHLFGQSAGAFSVLFHSVSRVSHEEALFSSVGLMSPTGNNSYFFQKKDEAVDMYEKFALYCGCPSEGSHTIFAGPADFPSCPLLEQPALGQVKPAMCAATPSSPEEPAGLAKALDETRSDAMEMPNWEIVPTSQMDCLRSIPWDELTRNWDEWTAEVLEYKQEVTDCSERDMPFWIPKKVTPLLMLTGHGAIVDGHPEGLLDFPIKLIEEGLVPGLEKIGLVAGVTSDEGSLFTVGLPLIIPNVSFMDSSIATSEEVVEVGMEWIFGPVNREKVTKFYEAFEYESSREKISRILSDFIFVCPTLDFVKAWPNPKKHLYLFDVKLPTVNPLLGVPHGLDVPFVLRRDNILWYLASGWYFKDAQQVSQIFSRSFVDMATYGRTRWPAWVEEQDVPRLYAKFSLEEGVTVEEYVGDTSFPLPSERVCNFWKNEVGILGWVDSSQCHLAVHSRQDMPDRTMTGN